MNILALSDLHLEFDGDEEANAFVSSLDPEGIDVVVLAGDICSYSQVFSALSLICKRFSESIVIWVHGNHEYYFSTRDAVRERSLAAMDMFKNLRWLDNDVIVVKDQRFLGTTLWFNEVTHSFRNGTYDFKAIKGLQTWVKTAALTSRKFLEKETKQGDIVITHYLPLWSSVSARFNNDPCNQYFVHNVEDVIRKSKPKLWIHGHTHDSMMYVVVHDDSSTTNVVCNPRGYTPEELNPDFRKDLVIKI